MAIEKQAGTYLLILNNRDHNTIQIGRRGSLKIKPGFYIYIGSAFGPGGIHARTAHHKKRQKNQHWHIDYLSKHTKLREIWFSIAPARQEHAWANIFRQDPDVVIPMAGFGASDCKCITHLFYSPVKPDFQKFRGKAEMLHSGSYEVQIERQ
jgi:Uri superfamily endonuclease